MGPLQHEILCDSMIHASFHDGCKKNNFSCCRCARISAGNWTLPEVDRTLERLWYHVVNQTLMKHCYLVLQTAALREGRRNSFHCFGFLHRQIKAAEMYRPLSLSLPLPMTQKSLFISTSELVLNTVSERSKVCDSYRNLFKASTRIKRNCWRNRV